VPFVKKNQRSLLGAIVTIKLSNSDERLCNKLSLWFWEQTDWQALVRWLCRSAAKTPAGVPVNMCGVAQVGVRGTTAGTSVSFSSEDDSS
jgi:erythromycin esterase-like protein